jgi:hypothetical protein
VRPPSSVAGAAGVGRMLLADVLFDGFHHHGPPVRRAWRVRGLRRTGAVLS